MSDRVNKDVGLSRRDFLKLAGAGFGTLAVEWSLGPLARVATYLDRVLNLDEGNAAQRYAKLQEAANKTVTEPELLSSWLKFCALEVYAGVNGLVLAEATLRRFMFGAGKSLDIKNLIPRSVRNDAGWLGDTETLDVVTSSDQEILEGFAHHAVNKALGINIEFTNRKFNIAVFPTGDEMRAILRDNRKTEILISGAGEGVNRDGLYSMNMFTHEFTGKIVAADEGYQVWGVEVVDGFYRLEDLYDWDDKVFFTGATLRLGDALGFFSNMIEKLGVRRPTEWLRENMDPEQFVDLLTKEIVRIDDSDGVRLQQSDLAQPFKIETQWGVPKMQIVIPNKVLG